MWSRCECGAWSWKKVRPSLAVEKVPREKREGLRRLLAQNVRAVCYVCKACGYLGFSLGGEYACG